MRKQTVYVQTGASRRVLGIAALGAFIILLLFLSVLIIQYEHPYVPPEFDKAAQTGVPTPPEGSGYDTIEAQGMFSFAVVGAMYQQLDGSLALYFTNPQSNTVNLQCEVFNEKGDTLYKSGALRPGEYLERLYPLVKIANEPTKIQMKVYAFEPDTWYSSGSVALSNVLQAY